VLLSVVVAWFNDGRLHTLATCMPIIHYLYSRHLSERQARLLGCWRQHNCRCMHSRTAGSLAAPEQVMHEVGVR
jgi:hypothetical protein